MRLQSLHHLIDVVRTVGRPHRVTLLGSSSLDPYDLALVKLIVGRPKDLELLQALQRRGLLAIGRLRQHYQAAPPGEREAGIAGKNLAALVSQLSTSPFDCKSPS